ncbi:MAG: carbohydrate kinase [Bacteroidales bacterium]|nr:carbohydrate kinase [Bacteroidales bacterium]
MYFIGYDIGSSSVKASIIEGHSGKCLATSFFPKKEMKISSPQPGWAEQNPKDWWKNLKLATREILISSGISTSDIKAIGISYQMHGLVLLDKNDKVLRPSIIWCDSRASKIGEDAFQKIGKEKCLSRLLNSPANFTASKLKWVKENEPNTFEKINKILLPGDYIAYKLTGEKNTTVSGLSEGMFWDFEKNEIADFLLIFYGIEKNLFPETIPTFSNQGRICKKAAKELGLDNDTLLCYRAGDQPNNAFSLNVLNPGEIAATAGTSGVIYGISNEVKYDPLSRINTFAHVNHSSKQKRLGVLLCINGTGILYSWAKNNIGNNIFDYEEMNVLADQITVGSEELIVLPFGNGAERIIENRNIFSQIHGLNFNLHKKEHVFRAIQEGIVFSLFYGMKIMEEAGIEIKVIRAGNANMFLSKVFRETLANLSGATIELFDTEGSVGAARGAGIGYGFYKNYGEAFKSFKKINVIEPVVNNQAYSDSYNKWLNVLEKELKTQ